MKPCATCRVTLLVALALPAACREPTGGQPPPPTPHPAAERTAQPVGGPRLRVLGTVQDGGLPHAACTCPRCGVARRDPRRRRAIASLALVLPETGRSYLIDATPDIREQMMALRDVGAHPTGRVDRAPVSGVLLTHAHIGHYTGLAFLGFEAVHVQRLLVYCTPRMAAFLRGNGPWDQLVRLGNVVIEEIRPGEPFRLESVEVEALRVPHRDEYADTVGFLLRGERATVLYVPDTEPWRMWDPPLPELLRAREVDVALLDGTFYSEQELPGRDVSSIGHPRMTSTMDLLESAVAEGRLEVFFTHLNHSNPTLEPDSPERAELESRGFRVLEDGQELPL